MMASIRVFVLLLAMPYYVFCERMEWGDNPDLVEESKPIQGREHIKLMVVMVGDSIDLECQVLFTSEPVSDVRWKVNGELINKHENPIVNNKKGKVLVVEHFKIGNVTKDMDGNKVSCEYDKGLFVGRVEAILQVFELEIETTEAVCETLAVKLLFKESKKRLIREENVIERVKYKIRKITKLKSDDISEDTLGYSVSLPYGSVKGNQAILARKPKFIKDGNVTDTLAECNTESGGSDLGIGIGVAFVIMFGAACFGIYRLRKKPDANPPENETTDGFVLVMSHELQRTTNGFVLVPNLSDTETVEVFIHKSDTSDAKTPQNGTSQALPETTNGFVVVPNSSDTETAEGFLVV